MKKPLIGLGLCVPVLCSSDCWGGVAQTPETLEINFVNGKNSFDSSVSPLCIIESLRG